MTKAIAKTKEINPIDYGLTTSKVKSIEQAFMPKIEERKALVKVYKNILSLEISEDTCEKAKEARKKFAKVRKGIADVHKSQKQFFLHAGRFVDAWKNKETLPINQMIDELEEIENHYENLETERLVNLQIERVAQLEKHEVDCTGRDFSGMESDVWEAYLLSKKNEHGERIELAKKQEAELIAKEKAEAEEREQIRLENIKLKKEAEERERSAKNEAAKRAKAEKVRQAKIDKERKEIEAKAKEEREVYELKLKIEREQKIKIQNELKAKQDEEIKAEKVRQAKIQEDLNKNDTAKVDDLLKSLSVIKSKYVFRSKKNTKMYTDVNILIDKVISHINQFNSI